MAKQENYAWAWAKHPDTLKVICYTIMLYIVSLSTEPVSCWEEASEHYQYLFFVCVTRFEQGFKGWTGNVIVINNIVSMGKFLDSF